MPIPCSTEAPLPRSRGFAEALKRRDEFHGVVSFSHFVPRLEVNPEKRYLIPSSLAKARPKGTDSSLYPPYPKKKMPGSLGLQKEREMSGLVSHPSVAEFAGRGLIAFEETGRRASKLKTGPLPFSFTTGGVWAIHQSVRKKKHESSVAQLLKDGLSRCPIVFEHFRGNHVLAPGKGGFDSSQTCRSTSSWLGSKVEARRPHLRTYSFRCPGWRAASH